MSDVNKQAYRAWISLRYRCKQVKKYAGVLFCDRWNYFNLFIEDMGMPTKGQSLDRIDGSKGYYKDNCRWATIEVQNRNRKCVILNELLVLKARELYKNGVSIRGIARSFGIKQRTMQDAVTAKTWRNISNGMG
jgi:hypothetical protein